MNEEIFGILNAIWTHTWKPNYRCHIVFTNKRLIVARMGLLRELLPYLDVVLGAGIGTILGGAAGAGAGTGGGIADASTSPITAKTDKERLEELRQISPEQILKSDKKNFDVSYSDILKIQVGRKLLTSRLNIYTPRLVHKFKFEGLTPEKVDSSIRSLIGDKIHIERVEKLD